MGGSKIGGLKTAQTNKAKYGEDYYRKLGKLGGKTPGKPKGFALWDKEKLREHGRINGRIGGKIGKRK